MARLSERLRLRASAASSSRISSGRVGSGPASGEQPTTCGPALAREGAFGSLAREEQSVSRRLYERLSDEEIAEVGRLMRESPDLPGISLDTAPLSEQRYFTLHFGMWIGLASIAEHSGLSPDQPPKEVHSMARGPLASAGGLYEADLVADALLSAGVEIKDLRRGALDFGCSSARVVRVLAAAFPERSWLGCDPNPEAIDWDRHHLPGIEFFRNDNEPPLPLQAGSLDLVFGISIWSHFEPELGLRWFEEMHRLIAPGGHLVMTTHGLTSVAHYAGNGLRSVEQCSEISRALYRRGWWYAPEFGAKGDWGVVNPDWGTAFVSSEWVTSALCPRWSVREFAPGRNAGNQDVYVLERM